MMFGKSDIKYTIMIVWLMAFTTVWITFQSLIPINSMKYQLNKIEESIENKNWTQAYEYTSEFKENFKNNRMFIQMNNATEALIIFEHTIGQLEITVKHEQDSALEYIGTLRETLNLVIKPFSGP